MTYIYKKCFASDLSSQWQFSKAAAFAFSIVTVLGFGNMQVFTTSGKVSMKCEALEMWIFNIFYLAYASVGIPLVMVFLTNLGKYVVDAITNLHTLAARSCDTRRRKWQLRNVKHVKMNKK